MQAKTIGMALRVLQTHFPFYFKDKTDADLKIMFAIWSEAFKEETDDRRFMRTIVSICIKEEFFPTIAKVREAYRRQALIDDVHAANNKNIDSGLERLLLGD